MKLHKYEPQMKAGWDNLVKNSRNGTFLLLRDYMDYHADRFTDNSLVATDNDGNIIGVLPAERQGITVSSHGGLTYGGWILGNSTLASATGMGELMELMTTLYLNEGVHRIVYKPVPHIYHRAPCEEDIYFTWRSGAKLEEVTLSSVIDLNNTLPMSRSTRTHINRAHRLGLIAAESNDLEQYWAILTSRLSSKYNTNPVHSLDEMLLLANRFPQNIRLWTVSTSAGEMTGGIVLYLCDKVAKAQYIASNDTGRRLNTIDFLVDYLIAYLTEQGYRYFDLGTSNENHGRYLNEGLITQKTRYGARGIAYPVYTIDIQQ